MKTRSIKLDTDTELKLFALMQERQQTAGEIIRSLIRYARLKNKNSIRILEESAKLRKG